MRGTPDEIRAAHQGEGTGGDEQGEGVQGAAERPTEDAPGEERAEEGEEQAELPGLDIAMGDPATDEEADVGGDAGDMGGPDDQAAVSGCHPILEPGGSGGKEDPAGVARIEGERRGDEQPGFEEHGNAVMTPEAEGVPPDDNASQDRPADETGDQGEYAQEVGVVAGTEISAEAGDRAGDMGGGEVRDAQDGGVDDAGDEREQDAADKDEWAAMVGGHGRMGRMGDSGWFGEVAAMSTVACIVRPEQGARFRGKRRARRIGMVHGQFGWAGVAALIVACGGPACAVDPVEARLTEAFERAKASYPQEIRGWIEHVEVRRQKAYGVPEDAPLMARLMGDAVYAFYSMNEDAVFVLDAGMAERANWVGGDAGEDEVAGLMRDLGLMDEDDNAVQAWERFVEAVQGWPGEEPIEGELRFGDGRVLGRFVRLGVGRALARDWEEVGRLDLDAQMVHELAHALQLGDQLAMASARMQAWGTLSGWVRADRNEPFDGFHSGIVMLEQPAVLGRLLISDERGEGLYAHAPGARFVNRYARYDAREDYAESVRLFMEDPGRLIEIDPTKFMYINALGYNAGLSLLEPGPLWIDVDEIEQRDWTDLVQRGARELLEGREGIDADARTVAGLLRAHAEVLSADGLPRWEVFADAALDVPESIRAGMNPEHFSAVIQGRRFGPRAETVRGLLEEAVIEWHDDELFWRAMDELSEPDAEGVEGDFAELEQIGDPQQLAREAARLFRNASRVVDRKRFAEMMAREVRAMRAADEPLLAELLKLRFAIEWNGSVSEDLVEHWQRLADEAGDVYSAIELRRGLVDLMLLWDEKERAVEAAKAIGGDSWGVLRRVESLCAIAQQTGDASVLDAATQSLAGRRETRLTAYLETIFEDTRAAIAGGEEDPE